MIVAREKDRASGKGTEQGAEVEGALAGGSGGGFGEDDVARDAGGGEEVAHGVGDGG